MKSMIVIKHIVMKSVGAGIASLVLSTAWADSITVSAAASLKEAFNDLKAQFEKTHPEHQVSLNFAASGSLLQQISHGAPVDVFASADLTTMQQAKAKNLLLGESQYFAKNTLVAIVPSSTTLTANTLQDLVNPTMKRIAIGNPSSVPAGRYAIDALKKSHVDTTISDKVVFTQNVRQALEYVANANVDLGFVYKTDASIMADRVKVAFEVPLDAPVHYPIAIIKDSKAPTVAQQFIEFVLSPEGQAVLAKYGFSRS
jgi:molybdate transport system substrate-binding protein